MPSHHALTYDSPHSPQVLNTDINAVKRKDMREKTFHVDDVNPALVSHRVTGREQRE